MERRTVFGSALALFKTPSAGTIDALPTEAPKEEARDAYQIEIEEHHHRFLMNTNPAVRAKAATDIAMLAWNGGEHAQAYVDKIKALGDFLEVLRSPSETEQLRLTMLKAISAVERNSRRVQDSLRESGFHRLLAALLDPSESDVMRKWAAHTLFYFVVGNPANQVAVLELPNIESRVLMASALDWSRFDANDAQELLLMLYPQ